MCPKFPNRLRHETLIKSRRWVVWNLRENVKSLWNRENRRKNHSCFPGSSLWCVHFRFWGGGAFHSRCIALTEVRYIFAGFLQNSAGKAASEMQLPSVSPVDVLGHPSHCGPSPLPRSERAAACGRSQPEKRADFPTGYFNPERFVWKSCLSLQSSYYS